MSILQSIAEAFPDHAETWIDADPGPLQEPIGFYQRADLAKIRDDQDDPDSTKAYVVSRQGIFHLDGSLDAIQSVNDSEKLKLSRKQVPEYIRFVFKHTGDGRLQVVEDASELRWDELSMSDPEARARAGEAARRIHEIEVSGGLGDHFVVVFNGVFRDLLVECEMEVKKSGELKPVSQQPVGQDLPLEVL